MTTAPRRDGLRVVLSGEFGEIPPGFRVFLKSSGHAILVLRFSTQWDLCRSMTNLAANRRLLFASDDVIKVCIDFFFEAGIKRRFR